MIDLKESNVPPRILRLFIQLAGLTLLLTGSAKIVSLFGTARALSGLDPLLSIRFKHLFLMSGILELVAALFCFYGKDPKLKIQLVAWLATIFLIYRVGLKWIGYSGPCKCLGSLTQMLHIETSTAGLVTEIMLGFLLIGGYTAVFWYSHFVSASFASRGRRPKQKVSE